MKIFFFFYRLLILPTLSALGGAGYGCRFVPSCSHYAQEAFAKHTFFGALRLSIQRICRCNPWTDHERYDPVPSLEDT